MLINRLYDFKNTFTAQADQVNAEFNQIMVMFQANIGGDNLKDGGIDLVKLSTSLQALIQGGGSVISDTVALPTKTWSSQRINNEIEYLKAKVGGGAAVPPGTAPPSVVVNPSIMQFPNFPQLQSWYTAGFDFFSVTDSIVMEQIRLHRTLPKLYGCMFVRGVGSKLALFLSDETLAYTYTAATKKAVVTSTNNHTIAQIISTGTHANDAVSITLDDVETNTGATVQFFEVAYDTLKTPILGGNLIILTQALESVGPYEVGKVTLDIPNGYFKSFVPNRQENSGNGIITNATSNTITVNFAPYSGTVTLTSSGDNLTNAIWKAFDNNSTTYWESLTVPTPAAPVWFEMDFTAIGRTLPAAMSRLAQSDANTNPPSNWKTWDVHGFKGGVYEKIGGFMNLQAGGLYSYNDIYPTTHDYTKIKYTIKETYGGKVTLHDCNIFGGYWKTV